MSKLSVYSVLCAAAVPLITACNSIDEQSQAMIDSVVTALPTEVEGCTFLGNVDTEYGSWSIENARSQLRLKTAQLGGNHLVETHMGVHRGAVFYSRYWGGPYADPDSYLLSGRAYFCPEGKGIIGPMRPGAMPLNKKPDLPDAPYRPEGHIAPETDTAQPPAAAGSLRSAPVASDEGAEVLASEPHDRPAPQGSLHRDQSHGNHELINSRLPSSPVSVGIGAGFGIHL